MRFDITTNKYGRNRIDAYDGTTWAGSAELAWVENDGYNAPHWASFESAPLVDSKWTYLGSSITQDEAIEKAKISLEWKISRSTLCG